MIKKIVYGWQVAQHKWWNNKMGMAIGTMEIERGCQEKQWDIKKSLGHEDERGNAFIPVSESGVPSIILFQCQSIIPSFYCSTCHFIIPFVKFSFSHVVS